MKIHELNHVGLNVRDVARSREFYAKVMGLPELPRPDFDFPGAWFQLGSAQELHLIGKRASGDGRFKECHFSLRVENVESCATRLATQGVEYSGPRSRPDGARQVFFHDPDGHQIELFDFAG